MKIGLFIQNYSIGGIQTFLSNLLNNYKNNNKIIIYYNKTHPDINFLKKKIKRKINYKNYQIFSIEDQFFKNSSFVNKYIKYIYILINPIIFSYQKFKLAQLFKKEKLDRLMVINGGYPGGDLCLAASISWYKINPTRKSWHNFHNIAVKKNKFFLNNFYKNRIDISLKKSTKGFISVSKTCSLSLKKRKELKKVKVNTIYNGLDIEKYNITSIRKELNLKQNSKILLMLAEYDLRKGHKFIIKVMQNILKVDKNVFLLICGFYNLENFKKIKSLVNESAAKKNIILSGFRKDKFNLIKQSDIVVIPSQEFESFGYVCLEAMGLKKPVVATNVGGLSEVIINNKTGFVINKKNDKEFANKILDLLKNKKLNKFISNNGYKRYNKHFSAKTMSKKYFETII